MKAKVKATGKVIEVTINKCAVPVQGCGASSVYQGDDGRTYYDTDLDFIHVYPDWQQVRIQASIDAMQGMLAHSTRYIPRNPNMNWHNAIAEEAVELSNALIEELKKTM